jgi:methyl-accepting chemotaxis protein
MNWILSRIFAAGGRGRDADEIASVCKRLEELNHTTEHDFLAVGSRLMDLRGTSVELAEMAQSIAGRISGSSGDSLLGSLEKLIAAVDAIDHRRGYGDTLGEVVSTCDQLRHSLDRMQQSVMTFQVLSMLTRVETARVNSEGDDWESLADQVKAMAGDISEQVSRTAGAAESLGVTLIEGYRTVSRTEETEVGLLRSVAEGLMREAEAFRGRRQAAIRASEVIAATYQEITHAMEELATGIQAHDITRQQIEHTVSTLRDATAGAHGLSSVAGLESAQLRATRGSFSQSAQSIRTSLDKISEQVQAILTQSAGLTKHTQAEEDSFYSTMEKGGKEALRLMAICRSAEDRIGRVMESSREIVAEASGRVEDLGSIGIAVERLALNAGIRATHLDAAGEPLSVLAAAVKTLAADSAGESSEMARLLGTMQTAIGSVDRESAQSLATPTLVAELERAIAEVHEATDFTSSQLDHMMRQGERLSNELAAARSEFHVDARFRQVVDTAIATLDKTHGDVGVTDRAVIENAANRYTMMSERHVHDLFGSGPAPDTAPVSAGEDSLGSNVELF